MVNRVKGEGQQEGTAMGQHNWKKIVGGILIGLGVLSTGTSTTGDPAAYAGAGLMTLLLSGVGVYLLYKGYKGIAA
jgi:hypothetical protein